MDSKLLARIGAVVFVAIAITMTAIEMSRPPAPPRAGPAAIADTAAATDPLMVELRRCQSLGASGASDPDCLSAWAENRRRFLGNSTGSAARPATTNADSSSAQEN